MIERSRIFPESYSLRNEIVHGPVNKSGYLISRKGSFVRSVKLKKHSCPLRSFQGVTKFSSVEGFFRACCAKQHEKVNWKSPTKEDHFRNIACQYCKQAKASQRGAIVVVLREECGIVIDEGLMKVVCGVKEGRR